MPNGAWLRPRSNELPKNLGGPPAIAPRDTRSVSEDRVRAPRPDSKEREKERDKERERDRERERRAEPKKGKLVDHYESKHPPAKRSPPPPEPKSVGKSPRSIDHYESRF